MKISCNVKQGTSLNGLFKTVEIKDKTNAISRTKYI